MTSTPESHESVPDQIGVLESSVPTGRVAQGQRELDEGPHHTGGVARPEGGQLAELGHHGPQAGPTPIEGVGLERVRAPCPQLVVEPEDAAHHGGHVAVTPTGPEGLLESPDGTEQGRSLGCRWRGHRRDEAGTVFGLAVSPRCALTGGALTRGGVT